ncbi:MAG: DUF1569 domain-containing protein [Bacteroidota bacterium]|nr:DUF1569 domain-containing protein [Bacteroidota bacterium]
MKKLIFNKIVLDEVLERIGCLIPLMPPLWGKMTAAQMLAHVNLSVLSGLGARKFKNKNNFFITLVLKPWLLNEKPFMKNAPTHPEFKITGERNFSEEKNQLVRSLQLAQQRGSDGPWADHPILGRLRGDEWGWYIYKHADHHLTQFGV